MKSFRKFLESVNSEKERVFKIVGYYHEDGKKVGKIGQFLKVDKDDPADTIGVSSKSQATVYGPDSKMPFPMASDEVKGLIEDETDCKIEIVEK